VVNLFGLRSRHPEGLLNQPDPVGFDNDEHVAAAFKESKRVVYAWGGGHAVAVRKLVRARVEGSYWRSLTSGPLTCGTLGQTADGSPRHPLMLAYATTFEAQR
jgi:hypothetical protein